MPKVVLKFGGSSVGDRENFFDENHMIRVANTIKRKKDEGNQVVVVISAMAGETRNLKEMSQLMSRESRLDEEDIVLAAGEQISAGLLSKLLNSDRFNQKAKAFLGWQLPILTNDEHGMAQITYIDTKKIEECLENDIIPIIAGFQGITKDGRITTLGFDGSDTTAVAVAGYLKADCCYFYKDVRGVYSANPRRVPKASKIEELSLEEMYVLSSLGARILHPVSINTAMDYNINLRLLPNFLDDESGTLIKNTDFKKDIAGITYYEHSPNEITISVVGRKIGARDGEKIIQKLNKNKIFAQVVKTEFDNMSVTVEIGWAEQLDTALCAIHSLYGLDNEIVIPRAFNGDGKQIYKDPAIGTM
ncbi:MAG: hypothetical protein J6Y29_06575 [Clostridiales bacterium]|nr:hypothetical protein [Clostridiales bacterium]